MIKQGRLAYIRRADKGYNSCLDLIFHNRVRCVTELLSLLSYWVIELDSFVAGLDELMLL